MKITNIITHKLSYLPKNPPRDGLSGISTRDVILVEVETDVGIIGVGEGFALASLQSTEVFINELLVPVLIGEDPTCTEALWEKMYKRTFRVGRRGLALAAISAIDIALWDIIGKKAGMPVYKLLGGHSRHLNAYASAGYYQEGKGLNELAEEMREYAKQGFKAVKMKVGGVSPEEDLARVRTARQALGDAIKLAVDANNSWALPTAMRMARKLEPLDIFFLEEPISSDDVDGSAELARFTDIPIAGYETEYTRYGLRDIIVKRAVNIVQTDAIWTGGISEARKIGILASAWGMKCIPHFSAGIVSLMANLHFAASLPNVEWFELTLDDNPLRTELSNLFPKVEEGLIYLNDAPGIGIELDREVLERYKIK
ncbi:MAG: mandelate racemase/muconate lactonizing enzyme family protein [Firmicutes bacterium]|nr:mandelate racemase/muconate lactonizing enzyme family protein [Bacillota bacterium]